MVATAAKVVGMVVAIAEVNLAGVIVAREAGVMGMVQMVEATLAALKAMETAAMEGGMTGKAMVSTVVAKEVGPVEVETGPVTMGKPAG